MVLREKLEILKAKIERAIGTRNLPKVDFLGVIASHNGFIMQDSITFSFREFKEKYGDEKFKEILNEFIEDGVVEERYGLQFAILNERGEFDYKAGEEIARFIGKIIFESSPQTKQVVDEIVKEPEGIELLKFIAKEKGVHIINGQEPKIKQLIGKRAYELIIDKLIKNNILIEYAWSSKKHGYRGYKLLPFTDDYIKSSLGMVELTDSEKLVLSYIGSFNEFFSGPPHWYIWFNYPTEYEHRTLDAYSLHKKFLALLINETEESVQKILEDLKRKNLLKEVDLGYTGSGYHRGTILQLSDSGERFASQTKEELKSKINDKTKGIFSNVENRATYYLFCKEKFPLKLLTLIKNESTNLLLKNGLISDKQDVFLAFKEGTPYHNYINSEIFIERIPSEIKEKCAAVLSREEKLFLGFLSECKKVILGTYQDWKSWSQVTPRTQRGYHASFEATMVNFPYLKRLFSYLIGLSLEEIDKITSNLENNAFLIQEKTYYGFPGHAITYRIPVKFDFDIDTTALRSKIKERIEFLTKDIEKYYNQLIFIDHLTFLYDARQCDFLVNAFLVKDLLEFLNYTPPSKYLPIYAFEDEVIVIHPWIKDEIKKEMYELKSKLIGSLKSTLLPLAANYQNNISYNFSEKTTKDGYFVIEIESPDPLVGTVSFVLTPWASQLDMQRINNLCEKSNTVNILIFYPNYPQLKKMLASANGRYNLYIIRADNAYVFLKRLDSISQAILTDLGKHFKIIKEEEKVEDELQELMEKFPNVAKVRMAISEAEKFLKDLLREFLVEQFGDKWEEKIREKYPEPFKTWVRRKEAWKEKHPEEPKDILEFPTLGELCNIIDSYPSFLKNYFSNSRLAQASIVVFSEKKIYHHGRPETDIPMEELELVRTAFRNLRELRRKI